MVTERRLVLRSTNEPPHKGNCDNAPRQFLNVHDVIEHIGNLYIDNNFRYDNQQFMTAFQEHVQWVQVTNCGPYGTSTGETYHQLEIYLQKIGTENKQSFNRQFNPKPIVMVKHSFFSDGGRGLFAATCIKTHSYISFYMGQVKTTQ